MRTAGSIVAAAVITVGIVGFSVCSEGAITANREFGSLVAGVGEPITVTFTLSNTDGADIRGFYYADHIPSGLSVTNVSVLVDGSPISSSPSPSTGEYLFEQGSIGEVYPDCRPYRWILEIPPGNDQNNPVSGSVVIEYQVQSATDQLCTFPNYNWVGELDGGGSGVFGYDEGSETIQIGLAGAQLHGTPQLTLFGTIALVAALAFAAVLHNRVYGVRSLSR